MKKRFIKKENAEVMVEASLILSVAVIVIFTLLYLGLIMYHQTLITSTANITASNIAQVYSNKYKDPISGYVDVNNLDKEGLVNKMKSQDYANTITKKAEWYSKYKMAKGQILKADEPQIDVKIENKNGSLLRAQVVVEINESYELPVIKFFGIDNPVIEYQAEGRADCFEIMDYVNIIEAADKIDVTENFTVTFHQKDNSVYKVVEVMHDMSIADTMAISAAEKTKFPADPTWDGEKFYRWKTATGETFTPATVVAGNIDVYPEFETKIYFDANGGTVNPNMKYVPKGKAIGSMPTPSKQYYAFDGWFTGKTDGKKWNSSTIVDFEGEMTLYAHWHCTHPTVKKGECIIYDCENRTYKGNCTVCGKYVKDIKEPGSHSLGHCSKVHTIYPDNPPRKMYSAHAYVHVGGIKVRLIVCPKCGKVRYDSFWCAEHLKNEKPIADDWIVWKNNDGSWKNSAGEVACQGWGYVPKGEDYEAPFKYRNKNNWYKKCW